MCKSKSHLVATAAGHARKSTRYLHTLFDELCMYARTQAIAGVPDKDEAMAMAPLAPQNVPRILEQFADENQSRSFSPASG